MEDNMLYLTGLCPYCSCALDYSEDAKAVKCHSCGAIIPTLKLELADIALGGGEQSDSERRIAEGVLSAEAGLAYIGNVFEDYDWAGFAETEKMTIPLLDAIADTCKVKFSTDPITYILDFRRIAVPVIKKVEGLELLEVEIIRNYKSDDVTDYFEYFDTYAAITAAIAANRDAMCAELATDIRLAAKFGADKLIIEDLERSLEAFKDMVSAINPISHISEIESYSKAKAVKDQKLVEKLREDKIDAKKTYDKAIALLDEGDIDGAMHLLHVIAGYADSEEIIRKHSSTFTFNGELVEMAGKRYLMVNREIPEFDLKNPDQYGIEYVSTLHEIKSGVPESAPAVSQISNLIGCYGTKIYFVRNNEKICYFDTLDSLLYANVVELDATQRGDYVIDEYHPVRFSSDRSKFFICKKLRDEMKRGCFGRKKKVKNGISRQNNYSVVLVDMNSCTARTILPAIVDVMDFFDDKLFYTTVPENTNVPSFRICNIEDGSNDSILDADCVIHNVTDGKIIYSLWAPSRYNMDIYSIDIETKESKLIDTNIRDYYTTFNQKVYYTVGNEDYNRLYSASYDGSDRLEIMENAGRICMLRAGWIYYVSGEGRNACLMKVSTDGKHNLLVASKFERLVKMSNGYIYYVSTADELRVVRTDGLCDKRITDSVNKEQIIIDESNVYCLRYEYVGELDGDQDGKAYSLYSTDLDGKCLRKVAFGVVSMKEYDKSAIYLCRKNKLDYIVTTPVGKKGSKVDNITREITTYCALDKTSAKLDTLATLGTPTASSITVRSGCLFRKKTREATVSEMPRSARYVRAGLSKQGAILDEEYREREAEKQAKIDRKNAKKAEKARIKAAKRA